MVRLLYTQNVIIIVHYPLLEYALYLIMVNVHIFILLKKGSYVLIKCDQIIPLL